jgi:translation initiation factor 1
VSFRKTVTYIAGLDPKTTDLKSLTKILKTKIACGGTFKDDSIELQGDHVDKVKKILVDNGFSESSFA